LINFETHKTKTNRKMSLKQPPILQLITPKGKKVELVIPNGSITAIQIQDYLESVDSGDFKKTPVLDVVTKKGKKVKIPLTKGMQAEQIVQMTDQIDALLEKKDSKKTGFWVANLKNAKGRYHTKEGCMGRASEAITQAQIDQDQRKKCDRCQHRDA